jgi:hypothetical protein
MTEWDGLNKKGEGVEGLTADESTRVESIRSRVEAIDKAAEDAAKKTEAERLAMRTRAQASAESFKAASRLLMADTCAQVGGT